MKSRLLVILASILFLAACGGESSKPSLDLSELSDVQLNAFVYSMTGLSTSYAIVTTDPSLASSLSVRSVDSSCVTYSGSIDSATSGTSQINFNCTDDLFGFSEIGYMSNVWDEGNDPKTYFMTGNIDINMSSDQGMFMYSMNINKYKLSTYLDGNIELDVAMDFTFETDEYLVSMGLATASGQPLIIDDLGQPVSGTVLVSLNGSSRTLTFPAAF